MKRSNDKNDEISTNNNNIDKTQTNETLETNGNGTSKLRRETRSSPRNHPGTVSASKKPSVGKSPKNKIKVDGIKTEPVAVKKLDFEEDGDKTRSGKKSKQTEPKTNGHQVHVESEDSLDEDRKVIREAERALRHLSGELDEPPALSFEAAFSSEKESEKVNGDVEIKEEQESNEDVVSRTESPLELEKSEEIDVGDEQSQDSNLADTEEVSSGDNATQNDNSVTTKLLANNDEELLLKLEQECASIQSSVNNESNSNTEKILVKNEEGDIVTKIEVSDTNSKLPASEQKEKAVVEDDKISEEISVSVDAGEKVDTNKKETVDQTGPGFTVLEWEGMDEEGEGDSDNEVKTNIDSEVKNTETKKDEIKTEEGPGFTVLAEWNQEGEEEEMEDKKENPVQEVKEVKSVQEPVPVVKQEKDDWPSSTNAANTTASQALGIGTELGTPTEDVKMPILDKIPKLETYSGICAVAFG